MNWNEYKTLAIRTESIPQNIFGALPSFANDNFDMAEEREINRAINAQATRLLHATMGACTELAELIDGRGTVNFVEEVGDVLWYLAIADDVISWHPKAIVRKGKDPIYWLGELNDVMKRHIFYGTELNTFKLEGAFGNILADLVEALMNKGFTLALAMEANIRKLEKRYPEKMFTAQAAIHRDVDRELDHIMLNGELVPRVETLLELETDEQLAEVVKERQGQPTVPVNLDDLVFPANVALDDAEWASIVNSNLSSAQLTNMAMALCTDKVAQLRKAGANLEAKAYDALYVMVGSSNSLLLDNSLYHMWESLGYSVKKADVLERLERWK